MRLISPIRTRSAWVGLRRFSPIQQLKWMVFDNRYRFFAGAPQHAFSITDVTKSIGHGRTLFRDVSLSFYDGAKIGVLGPNGAGKSSLLNIIYGTDEDFDGEVWIREGIDIGYLRQNPSLEAGLTVAETVAQGLRAKNDALKRYAQVNERFSEPNLSDKEMEALIQEQTELTCWIDERNAWDAENLMHKAMRALNLPHPDARVESLSGGEKRRVDLCRMLLAQPDALFLDEPTNHLDPWSIEWLEEYLANYKGTVLAVTHDRYFLDHVAEWILEIDAGRVFTFKGNYNQWLAGKQVRMSVEGKASKRQSKQIEKELAWIEATKSHAAKKTTKARKKRAEELIQSDKDAKALKRVQSGAIVIPQAHRLGDKVIQARRLSKSFSGRGTLFEDLSFTLGPKMRVGVVGSNGSGKTTLFHILTGALAPDSGELDIGASASVQLLDQRRDLDLDLPVHEAVADGQNFVSLGERQVQIRAYISTFNLKGDAQEKRVRDLSGGERNRVYMARQLKEGANVLLMDEPTNDLDVATLRSLEDALLEFEGCCMIISHDRWFLSRLCTHILAFPSAEDTDRTPRLFQGSFEEFTREKKSRGGTDNPVKTKRRKLRKGRKRKKKGGKSK